MSKRGRSGVPVSKGRNGGSNGRNGKKKFRPGKDRTGGFYGRYAVGGGELKFHDVDLDDAVIASGGTVTASINLIAQGVTEKTRVGRKCTIRSINWRFNISLPERDAIADPEPAETVRVIMFQDKQCNGAAAPILQISEVQNYQTFNNLANAGRFRTLVDRTYDMNAPALASDGAGVVSQTEWNVNGTFFKKCNIPLEFDNTTGAITELRSNNIGVLLYSRSGIASFESKIRLRFSDGS